MPSLTGVDLLILYGSQTGTAEDVGERIAREGMKNKRRVYLSSMDDYVDELIEKGNCGITNLCIICSTTGQGEEPDNMKKFWLCLRKKSCPIDLFLKTNFAVLGLGDSSYAKFNFVAKKLHKRILQLGGHPIQELGLADDQHELGPDGVIDPWLQQFWSHLGVNNNQEKMTALNPKFEIKFTEARNNPIEESYLDYVENRELIENKRLTPSDHFQDVRLFTFDLNNSKISYDPGDVLYIQPSNLDEDVDLFFELFPLLECKRDEIFTLVPSLTTPWARIPKELLVKIPLPWTWAQCAKHYFDIKSIPRRYFFELLAFFTDNELEKEKLVEFTTPEGQQDLYSYCNRPKRNILEVLQDFPHARKNIKDVSFLFDLIPPIKPRAFSIASSQRAFPHQIQILVAVVNYQTKLKKPREGLCSTWLSRLEPNALVPMWVKKGSFIFPNEGRSMIMIGPGTGCAPFRSFISEQFDGKSKLVLFFGCRNESKDFFFKQEWTSLKEMNQLMLFTAFSRDNEDKDQRRTYVQHKIEENGEILWKLIEEGGSIFIAGNAKQMPLGVSDAFKEIFKIHCPDADAYMKELVKTNRYQTEVWG